MSTGLSASLQLGTPAVDVDFEVPAGATVAVLGPNGAGKSSVLNLLAGLLRPDRATVRVGDRVLVDDTTFVAPHRRSVALLSQQARLFPHMTVRQNIAFAPSSARLGRAEVRSRTQDWMRAVGVVDLADRKPTQLSGGQAQRVAVARALAADPDVLLLDEPFAALDVDVAARLRTLIGEVLADRGRITLFVTHDIVDAVSLADTAFVMAGGRIVDRGPVRDVLANPVNDFAARLAGLNLVGGLWRSDHVAGEGIAVIGEPVDGVRPGASVLAAFAPRSVAVYRERPHGSPRNVFAGTVAQVVPHGDRALARVECATNTIAAELTWAAVADLGLTAGTPVHLAIKASEVTVYPTATREVSSG
ncbi:sulfate/molybdate ABC transporter ATP-binding protein [Williamsia phyllosphaerae]|uniref:Molybdenum ABC transporter ATP-binding protein n=1 Tax=Williamsia phyllosphaerae TaxID=885042 RepID=A0ABQ1UAQ5_9NOCA|nr:ATP-binding cassette domain-containing protein [Williamsia phyllosphaerae]GGF14322.1 molybdenum ABC transporter ATP-binding protein [Williamsia phyllosphaerae]